MVIHVSSHGRPRFASSRMDALSSILAIAPPDDVTFNACFWSFLLCVLVGACAGDHVQEGTYMGHGRSWSRGVSEDFHVTLRVCHRHTALLRQHRKTETLAIIT